MPRAITTHAINPCNQALKVVALDGPGAGGASHAYDVMLEQRTQLGTSEATSYRTLAALRFQNGPVKETGEGANGITHEALLAVLIDRLESFQRGPYACEENAAALHGLRSALRWLNIRTQRREASGVEGTMQPDPAERRERAAAAAEQIADAGEACATCSGFGLLVSTAEGVGCPGCGKVCDGIDRSRIRAWRVSDTDIYAAETAAEARDAAIADGADDIDLHEDPEEADLDETVLREGGAPELGEMTLRQAIAEATEFPCQISTTEY